MRIHLLGTVLIAALLAIPAQQSVPASLLESARLEPAAFARALAAAHIPAGMEIREEDYTAPSELAKVDIHGPKASLDEVVSVFNSHHREYSARMMPNGVVVIRPTRAPAPFLDEASLLRHPTKVAGAMDAADLVFSPLDPRLAGGVVLNRIPDDTPVVLDGTGGRTVLDTLNQIVVQAPLRCWVVRTRRENNSIRIAQYGFIEASGAERRRGLRYQDR